MQIPLLLFDIMHTYVYHTAQVLLLCILIPPCIHAYATQQSEIPNSIATLAASCTHMCTQFAHPTCIANLTTTCCNCSTTVALRLHMYERYTITTASWTVFSDAKRVEHNPSRLLKAQCEQLTVASFNGQRSGAKKFEIIPPASFEIVYFKYTACQCWCVCCY
jgi:hypothetical protein